MMALMIIIVMLSFELLQVNLSCKEFNSESGYNRYLIQKFMNATDEDTSTLDSLFKSKRMQDI